MDIQYLLWLQSLREKSGPVIEKIFSFLTDIPFNPVTILLVCVIYWCLNKRMGFLILLSQTLGTFVTNVVKLCVCAYRPWIRDARINPPPKVQAGATGYSFPSGHTQTIVGIYGTLGYSLIQEDKKARNRKWLWAIILCAVLILIVAFSRNFLSVHTPQDVITGLLIGLIIIYLSDILLKWEEKDGEDNNRDIIIAAVGTAVVIAASVFVLLKPYPIDYRADGSLVVDPAKMKNDFFSGAGSFVAILWGRLIEKRWIKFSTEGSLPKRILRAVMGMVCVGIIFVGTSKLLKPIIPSLYAYYLIKYFLLYFVTVAAYPAAFAAVQKKRS